MTLKQYDINGTHQNGFSLQGVHGAHFAKSFHGVQELLYVYYVNPGRLNTPISLVYLGPFYE